MTTWFLVTARVAAALATEAAAPGRDSADASAYCEYTRAAADQEAIRLMSPDLFASLGWIHQPETVFGETIGDVMHPRALVGLSYSLGALRRGLLTQELADAKCARYRLLSSLDGLLATDGRAFARRALQARLAVLEQALPRADEMLADARARLPGGKSTTVEVAMLAMRVEALHAAAAETRRDVEALPDPAPLVRQAAALLPLRDGEEARVARAESRLREADFWDVELRGGYDRVSGVPERVPWYGFVMFRLNLGAPWQHAAGKRAEAADRRWATLQAGGVHQRTVQTLRELDATRRAERQRLRENTLLVSDLDERVRTMQRVPAERVERHLDAMWFDLVKALADRAYLTVHVEDLDAFLGPSPAP